MQRIFSLCFSVLDFSFFRCVAGQTIWSSLSTVSVEHCDCLGCLIRLSASFVHGCICKAPTTTTNSIDRGVALHRIHRMQAKCTRTQRNGARTCVADWRVGDYANCSPNAASPWVQLHILMCDCFRSSLAKIDHFTFECPTRTSQIARSSSINGKHFCRFSLHEHDRRGPESIDRTGKSNDRFSIRFYRTRKIRNSNDILLNGALHGAVRLPHRMRPIPERVWFITFSVCVWQLEMFHLLGGFAMRWSPPTSGVKMKSIRLTRAHTRTSTAVTHTWWKYSHRQWRARTLSQRSALVYLSFYERWKKANSRRRRSNTIYLCTNKLKILHRMEVEIFASHRCVSFFCNAHASVNHRVAPTEIRAVSPSAVHSVVLWCSASVLFLFTTNSVFMTFELRRPIYILCSRVHTTLNGSSAENTRRIN